MRRNYHQIPNTWQLASKTENTGSRKILHKMEYFKRPYQSSVVWSNKSQRFILKITFLQSTSLVRIPPAHVWLQGLNSVAVHWATLPESRFPVHWATLPESGFAGHWSTLPFSLKKPLSCNFLFPSSFVESVSDFLSRSRSMAVLLSFRSSFPWCALKLHF